MYKIKSILFALFVAILCSCHQGFGTIDLVSVKNVAVLTIFDGIKCGADLEVQRTGGTVTFSDSRVELTSKEDGESIVEIVILKDIVVKDGDTLIPVEFEVIPKSVFSTVMAVVTELGDMESLKDKFNISVESKVKYGVVSKRIKLEDISISDLEKSLGKVTN